MAMRPGQDELLEDVNDFVAKNTANGELNKLYHKWLGSPTARLRRSCEQDAQHDDRSAAQTAAETASSRWRASTSGTASSRC